MRTYIHTHVDKKRSDEDLAELDSKNKITKEIVSKTIYFISTMFTVVVGNKQLYPKRRRGYDPDESIDDGEEDDEYDSTSSSDEHSR